MESGGSSGKGTRKKHGKVKGSKVRKAPEIGKGKRVKGWKATQKLGMGVEGVGNGVGVNDKDFK